MTPVPRPRTLLYPTAASLLCYLAVAWLSRQFHYGRDFEQRPILLVLALFGLAFVCYLVAIWIAVRTPDSRRLLFWIIVPAALFRAVLLPSRPIQEVDIYRYIWDGHVTAAGVSPFRYSPRQVRDATPGQPLPEDFAQLVAMRDRSGALASVLSRVHFPELPTVYPPASQAVFAVAAMSTPQNADVPQRIVFMKAWFFALDMGIIWIVILLVRLAGLPWGWSVAYAWCPLVMKEFANSGHLDVIAVLLCVAALYVAARAWGKETREGAAQRTVLGSIAAAVILGLAVGAKLYPVVLAPLLGLICIRQFGWRPVVAPAAAFVATVAIVLWPMFPDAESPDAKARDAAADIEHARDAPLHRASATQDPSAGLRAFLRSWEMNDLMFLVVYENLRPHADADTAALPWFLVTPQGMRKDIRSRAARWTHGDADAQAFFSARLVTLAFFGVLAFWFAWRASASADVRDWLEAAFLTLAWFWLLSPTQNPWYWAWALPLVPFARSRVWLLASGLVLLYYLRFWFAYHYPTVPVPPTNYLGPAFFDFVVTWIEHGTLLVLLAAEWLLRRRAPDRSQDYRPAVTHRSLKASMPPDS